MQNPVRALVQWWVRRRESKKDLILKLLLELDRAFPLDVKEASGGRLAGGTVYELLPVLEVEGLVQYVTVHSTNTGRKRRQYFLTPEGRARAHAVSE